MYFAHATIILITFLFGLSSFAQTEPSTSNAEAPTAAAEAPAVTNGSTPPRSTKKKKSKPSKKKSKPKDAGQSAKIKVDGSAVYQFANFDSPVLTYMDRGKKARVSKKIYPGIGGLGAFYKLRIKKGQYGYVADTDVEVVRGRGSEDDADADDDDDKLEEDSNDPTKLQTFDEPEPLSEDGMYLTKYVGLTYMSYNYAETLRKKTEVESVPMIGIRHVGPTSVMGGMPLDLNFYITTTAPKFYDEISSSTSGLMMIFDALVMMPFYDSPKFIVTYGAGAMLRYSKWGVKLRNQPSAPPLDSQAVVLGATLDVGAAYLFNPKAALRADIKYNYESEGYLGIGASFLFKY